MTLLERLAGLVLPPPEVAVEVRSAPWQDVPSFEEQLAAIRARRAVWPTPSIVEALSVPAIFRAVTLISNTVGSLALEAYRDGVRMAQVDAPRIVVRPNPRTTPREFYRDVSYCLATRGESWLWIAKRAPDGTPLSLFPIPPQQIVVTANDRDALNPEIRWNDRVMSNADIVQLVLTREPGDLRGAGPLQRCGAAVSVAVEANQYAANFLSAGGVPSVLVKSAVTLDDNEAAALKAQWIESPPNVPRIVDPTVESVEVMGSDPEKAGLSASRSMDTADVAREFGIPGALLEYQASGSSLTYQNVSEVYVQFVRTCLAPNYLEPIEQAMNDLLTRSTVTRFNVDGLLRADIKTRFDVHTSAIESGIYDATYAQAIEGIAPGSVETAPIPPAQPAADITSLPFTRSTWTGSLEDLRCERCGRLVGRVSGPAEIRCNRCGATVTRAA